MELDIFEETKKQIIKVQKWIGNYNLKFERLRNTYNNYTPPSIYFTLRNKCESLRTNKLRLIQRKNQLESQIKDN